MHAQKQQATRYEQSEACNGVMYVQAVNCPMSTTAPAAIPSTPASAKTMR
jgi:hypothetical protein